MAVTLREIAEYTGLSKPTVTRVLGRDAHLFSPATRQRVFEAAAKLGYRVNSAAKAMNTGRFGCAALVMGYDTARSDLPIGMMMGMQDELAARDMHLTVTRLPDEKLTSEGLVPKVLRENMADGMMINYTHDIPERMLELIRTHHAPAVWVNTKLDSDCIYADDVGGARLLTETLIQLGHRKIGYIKYDPATHHSTTDRREGYTQAMRAAGLTPSVFSERVAFEDQMRVTHELLGRRDRPTAVIVRPEDATLFFYVAAQLGLHVPKDLSISCIAGGWVRMCGMQVTSVLFPSREIGVEAVKMLVEKIERPDAELSPVCVPFQLDTGTSVARLGQRS
ncbi:MAG TPA: LacI family DNA-binding transcriptional regulator [Tepidisphaeraceae bacterium]|nr:LacI family DNA-binding transcriptional regulator [Tepidisphaeraceae bacterium]